MYLLLLSYVYWLFIHTYTIIKSFTYVCGTMIYKIVMISFKIVKLIIKDIILLYSLGNL